MEYREELDNADSDGHIRPLDDRCPCCGSTQFYEEETGSLDYACVRCGAVVNDMGEIVKKGELPPYE